MTESQQTMTESAYATGETDVIGDRFSPSVVLFWLKTSVAASNMRVMYKSPNTLLGVIVASVIIRAFAEWILERPTRAERRAMKRSAVQFSGGTTMYMPVSEEVAMALDSDRNERHDA